MGQLDDRKHPTVDGSLGFRFDVPVAWQLVEESGASTMWRTPLGDAILIEHLKNSVVVLPRFEGAPSKTRRRRSGGGT